MKYILEYTIGAYVSEKTRKRRLERRKARKFLSYFSLLILCALFISIFIISLWHNKYLLGF